jgi:molybdopterin converting factor small subunit
MAVTVILLAQLRQVAGAESITLPHRPILAELLRLLVQTQGEALRPYLFTKNEEPTPSLLCFLGDAQMEHDQLLQDGITLTLLSPIAGG